jgi:hypothetical protein
MSSTASAFPVPAKAEATPTSAEKPLFEAAGFVMAYFSSPLEARSAMSFHVTFGLPTHPNRRARLVFTPSTTGDSAIDSFARIFVSAPASDR